VRFAFGRAEYEIDLNKKNAAAFRKELAPSSNTPVEPGGDRASGRCVLRQAASAVPPSGHGRNSKVSQERPQAHPGERG